MGRLTTICAAGKVSESKNKSTRIKTWLKCSEQFHEHRNWWSSVSSGFVSCCWLTFSRFLQSLHRVLNTILYCWYLKLAFPCCQHHLPSHRVYGLQLLFLFWFLLLTCRSCYKLFFIPSLVPGVPAKCVRTPRFCRALSCACSWPLRPTGPIAKTP